MVRIDQPQGQQRLLRAVGHRDDIRIQQSNVISEFELPTIPPQITTYPQSYFLIAIIFAHIDPPIRL